MSRTFVMGDIHGAYKALVQCLSLSGFNPVTDHLICLGDVCDRKPETRACIDALLRIPRLTYLMGNHDAWALEWMRTRIVDPNWAKQGGLATLASYDEGVPDSHIEFLTNARAFHVENNRLFVHAGIDPSLPLTGQSPEVFLWDRDLGKRILHGYLDKSEGRLTAFDEIYIGHTPVPFHQPISAYEVWMMDTGAGWSGVLTMMDIDTKEIFQSDSVKDLYPTADG